MYFIISTIRLGVEEYITSRQDKGLLPTRVLLSTNTKNMFKSCDRNCDTSSLKTSQAFVDMLYVTKGQTMAKLEDGSWEAINVVEGFSQSCPLSPMFAGIVLNHILQKIGKMMLRRAHKCH